MKLLVDGASVANQARLHSAVLGLARRGHQVFWLGPGAEAARAAVSGIVAVDEARRAHGAEIVVGAGKPLALAHRGWFAGARCLLAALDPAGPGSWGWLDRWAWSSLAAFALVEGEGAEALRSHPGPLALDRVGLWSDEAPGRDGSASHPDCEILERAGERIRARQRSGAPRPAVFLDRDGTLIEEVGYLSDPAHVRLLPGVAAALARLRAAGFALVVISNQAGVGRGYFTLDQVHGAMAELRRRLRAAGLELDGVYFCPHTPEAGCACRKPGTELLERAAEDLGLTLRGSAMVGDKRLDVETGQRAGGRGVLVGTGYGGGEPGEGIARPDFRAPDLGAAASWLVAEAEGAPLSG